MSAQSSQFQQKDSKMVVASPQQEQATDSSSSPATTETETATTETKEPSKFPLHLTVTCVTLAFLIIALAISLSGLFDGSFNTVIKAVNLLADETIQVVAQKIERVFQRSTSSVAGAVNSTKIFGNPYQYNETIQPEQFNRVYGTYVSHLYRYGVTLQDESGMNVRFSQNSATTFTSSLSSGFVKQQICSTPYKKFSDIPANLEVDPLTCEVQAYNRTNLELIAASNPIAQTHIALSTRTLWLGPVWNFSKNVILASKSTTKPIYGFFFPQLTFFQLPPSKLGAKDREFFMYQYAQMSFDRSTGAPIANALGVFATSHFSHILHAALPVHKEEEQFESFLVDASGHVLSASHVTRPFVTIYLNTTGGKVWKGCNVYAGFLMGCFYNTSDYAPYRLLHLALTSPIHKNWTQQQYLSPSNSASSSSFSSSESNSNNRIFSNVVGEADDLEEQVVVFKKQINSEFSGLSVFLYVMIPMKAYLSPVYSARRTTIALVVVLCLVGGVLTYLILRRSTSSIQDLAEKMKDPFRAKLSKHRHREAKEQIAKQRVEDKHQQQQQKQQRVLEEEEPKKQEQEKDSKKEEEEETDSVSWYQSLVEWKPAEIVVLEEEFLAFREVIDKLRGFMNYDFAGAANAKIRRSRSTTISSNATSPNPITSSTKLTSSSSTQLSDNRHDIVSIGREKNDDVVVAALNELENSSGSGSGSTNAQQQAADKKQHSENPKGILKKSSSSTKLGSSGGGGDENNNENDNEKQNSSSLGSSSCATSKKKGISFRSDVPIPSGPAKPIMTNRKHSPSPSSGTKAALFESSMCFVAAIQVPIFTQPDNFFYLDHGDEAKQIFIDVSKFIVEKLALIALSNGATLLDFCGDFFLIAIQIRKRVIKTKAPTRFSLDLMRVAKEIQEEVNNKIVKKYSAETNSQTHSLVKLENFLPWNDTSPLFCTNIEKEQQQSSATTSATTSTTTSTTTPTQQSSNHVKTSPTKKKTIEAIFLDDEICHSVSINDAVSALTRTKPGKRATTEKDIAAISVAMHRECVLYAGLSFGWTRLFQWRSFNNNEKSDNNSNNKNNFFYSRTSTTETNIKQEQQPSTFSRSITIFGEAISQAFAVVNTMKKAEFRRELDPLCYAIGFARSSSDMFEMVTAKHVSEIARILSIRGAKKQKKNEADEEEIAQDEQERELRQQQQQQQQRKIEQLQQQFKQLQQQKEQREQQEELQQQEEQLLLLMQQERAQRQQKQQREIEQQKQRQQELDLHENEHNVNKKNSKNEHNWNKMLIFLLKNYLNLTTLIRRSHHNLKNYLPSTYTSIFF